MQRLKLEDRSELRGPAQLLVDDVSGDLGGKRQWESHKSEDSNKGGRAVNQWRQARRLADTRESSKFQTPSTRETPNSKHQSGGALLGASLFGASLELGFRYSG